jgi:ketosteroid isomerase-like protein
MRADFVVLASLAFASCATLPSITVERELLEADRAFATRTQQVGAALAFQETLDPQDGMVVRPGALYEGMSEFQAAFTPSQAEASQTVALNWAPDRAFVADSGEMGVTSGRFVRTVNGAATAHGRYVTVWRKDAQGSWRVLIDVGNTDPAQFMR